MKIRFLSKRVTKIGIRYSRKVVKSIKQKSPISETPRLMVHGGSGFSKSIAIYLVKQ